MQAELEVNLSAVAGATWKLKLYSFRRQLGSAIVTAVQTVPIATTERAAEKAIGTFPLVRFR